MIALHFLIAEKNYIITTYNLRFLEYSTCCLFCCVSMCVPPEIRTVHFIQQKILAKEFTIACNLARRLVIFLVVPICGFLL